VWSASPALAEKQQDSLHPAVEKHTNSIFTKLGLSEEKDLNRRVKAVLLFLSEGRGG